MAYKWNILYAVWRNERSIVTTIIIVVLTINIEFLAYLKNTDVHNKTDDWNSRVLFYRRQYESAIKSLIKPMIYTS